MDEDDKDDRAINKAEGHDKVGVLGAVWASKGQIFLRRFGHTDLVEARDGAHKPFLLRTTKGVA